MNVPSAVPPAVPDGDPEPDDAGPKGACAVPVGLEATRLLDLLAQGAGGGVIYVAADEPRAEEVAACLAALAPERDVLVFPSRDALPGDSAPAEAIGMRMSVLRRLAARDRPGPVVVTSPDAVLPPIPPPDGLRSFRVERDADLDVEALQGFCEAAGYAIDDRVDEPGEIAIRGTVIDVFPGGRAQPVRIERDADRVVDIRVYDPVTQRTTEPVDAIVLDAVGEDPAGDALQATLLDHMPEAELVEAPGAAAARHRFIALAEDAPPVEGGEGDGRARPCLGEEDWRRIVGGRGPRVLDLAGHEPVPRFVAGPRPGAALMGFLEAQLRGGRRVVLAAPAPRDLARLERRAQSGRVPRPERAASWREALDPAFANPVAIAAPFERGFVDARRNLVVVAAADLFGAQGPVRAGGGPAAALWQVEIAELHIGDFVVHAERGIGRLEGLEPLQAGEVSGEAIRLGYAEGETLLVPATEAGKLWRYGSEDADVAPDRLSGDAWSKRRAKVAAALAQTGRDLVAAMTRRRARPAPRLVAPRRDLERFAARFPFRLTPDQQGAVEATLADLGAGVPMNRLVVGDVGFGKTEVALRAAAAAALAGAQVAVVAPTTVLARQHYETFRRRFAGFDLEVAHLSRLVAAAEARRVRAGLADGRVRIAVGTHALLGKGVAFADLGLLVIDEEQRFGTAHKRTLRRLGEDLHVLSMTATPIPRTLQGALVGLQDLSVIATPPLRRRPIRTLVAERDRATLRHALLHQRRRGGQSFVVVPRVEDMANVERDLRALLPDFTLRVAHGQMPAREVDEAMVGFSAGEGDILLATSIIESGLDVPRANTMIVLGPDRFGLAQLHQLRGRVGRSRAQAYCYLMTEPGAALSEAAQRRLGTLATLERLGSGLAISVQDLDQRGAGELFGDRQAGHVRLIGLGLYQELLAAAIREARGEPHPPAEVTLQFDTAGVIPEDYVPEPVVRITLYHRLARSRSLAETDQLADEIADRFGPVPPPLEALLQAARIRALAASLGVERIAAGPEGIALTFGPRVDVPDVHADTLARLGEAVDWNGERLLLRAPSETPEQARDLVLDLLTRLV